MYPKNNSLTNSLKNSNVKSDKPNKSSQIAFHSEDIISSSINSCINQAQAVMPTTIHNNHTEYFSSPRAKVQQVEDMKETPVPRSKPNKNIP